MTNSQNRERIDRNIRSKLFYTTVILEKFWMSPGNIDVQTFFNES